MMKPSPKVETKEKKTDRELEFLTDWQNRLEILEPRTTERNRSNSYLDLESRLKKLDHHQGRSQEGGPFPFGPFPKGSAPNPGAASPQERSWGLRTQNPVGGSASKPPVGLRPKPS